jgi:hypothetical protein
LILERIHERFGIRICDSSLYEKTLKGFFSINVGLTSLESVNVVKESLINGASKDC